MSPGKRLEQPSGNQRVILAFTIIQLISAGGLTLILLTALISKRVKRHSTWYNFTASWIFSCLCYTLLSFAGQQVGGSPNHTLCTIQSALIYAAPVLTAGTTLSLVIHMFLSFRILLYTATPQKRPVTELMLISIPYFVWDVVVIGIVVFAVHHPETVQRSPTGTYCISTSDSISRVVSLVVVIAAVAIIILLSVLAYRIIRNRRFLLQAGTPLSMLLRVFIFSIIGFMTLAFAVALVITCEFDGGFDILLACIPLLAFLIFGSQPDLIRVWLCRGGEYVPANNKLTDSDDSKPLGQGLGHSRNNSHFNN